MILSEAAGIAAAHGAEGDLTVQDVPYAKLLPALRKRNSYSRSQTSSQPRRSGSDMRLGRSVRRLSPASKLPLWCHLRIGSLRRAERRPGETGVQPSFAALPLPLT